MRWPRRRSSTGKHVFVEKPFTSTGDQAEELVELAAKKKLRIMVDHTFLFTGAVKKIKELIDSGELGKLLFYDSVAGQPGPLPARRERDLGPGPARPVHHGPRHRTGSRRPSRLTARSITAGGLDDIAYVTVEFEDQGFIAHFHVNWLTPVKVRKTLIGGDRKMLVWNDLDADEKIKVYDKGVDIKSANGGKDGIHDLLVSYRSGDVHIPKLEATEALKAEAQYFVECIGKDCEPFNNGESGLQVVRLLEAADESLKNGGKRVTL